MSSEQPVASDRQAWEQALTAIEQGLETGGPELDHAIDTVLAWRASGDIGPIPADLVPRVRQGIALLDELIGLTAARMDAVRRQQAATTELASATGRPTRSVYLDTSA